MSEGRRIKFNSVDIMKFDLKEKKFLCPYCGTKISVFLDPSVSKQKYYEECEVCCNSIEINYEFVDGALSYFHAACEE